MEVPIPIIDREIDTSDPSGSGKTLAAGSLGFAALFGIASLGAWVYRRGKDVAGVEGETDIPGV